MLQGCLMDWIVRPGCVLLLLEPRLLLKWLCILKVGLVILTKSKLSHLANLS